MKKIISFLLCLTLLFSLAVPAYAQQEEELYARLSGYSDTDRGFILVLTMCEAVTGVTDSFSVRQQNLKNGEEQFGYDIPQDRISVILPCAENGGCLEVYLFEYELKKCDTICVKGLQTNDGVRTLTEQLWSGNSRFLEADLRWNLGLLNYYWKDKTVHLTGDTWKHTKGLDLASLDDKKKVVCVQGDVLYAKSEARSVELTADGGILARNEDGTFTAKETGKCTVSASLRGGISYTWDVSVLTQQEWKDYCIRMVRTHPADCMQTWIAGAALLFSFPPLTILLPLVLPLAVISAPAVYVGLLLWTRFFL